MENSNIFHLESKDNLKEGVEKYIRGTWNSVREEIMSIENQAFSGKGYSEDFMEDIFENSRNINYIIKDISTGKIIGYTSALIQGDSAYIMNTAIAKEHQGQGKVAALMRKLEEELVSLGIQFITRDAAIENGYADKIQKNYGNRIIETHERYSPWGRQKYFKIKL